MAAKYVQDMPRKGGYPEFRLHRSIRPGPSSAAIVIGLVAMQAYGFYQLGKQIKRDRYYQWRKVEARQQLAPLLQAEEDRRYLQWKRDMDADEAEVMKDVAGWKAGQSVYHTDRWVKPTRCFDPGHVWRAFGA